VASQLNPRKHSAALAHRAKRVWLLPGLLLLLVLATPRPDGAQNPEALLPGQSAAKAKELIQEAIQALGGQAYLNVRDITYQGRLGQFATTGDLSGYAKFYDFTKLPDKDRTEFYKQRNIITVYNGDRGWDLDRGGVQEISADRVRENQESLKRDIDYVFRFRMKEEGMIFRYAGADIVDLKQVEWAEIVDPARNTLRIAFDLATHLPLRTVAIVRDRETRERSEEITFFSNYHPIQGVMTPLQVARERNGRKIFQVFLDECKYNTGLPDSLFTRESLEQRFGELNKGKKKK